jgi:hypothetical protein
MAAAATQEVPGPAESVMPVLEPPTPEPPGPTESVMPTEDPGGPDQFEADPEPDQKFEADPEPENYRVPEPVAQAPAVATPVQRQAPDVKAVQPEATVPAAVAPGVAPVRGGTLVATHRARMNITTVANGRVPVGTLVTLNAFETKRLEGLDAVTKL